MRFMSIVTSPQPMKAPTPALMEAMGKLAEREIKAGRMIDMGGLTPLQEGARVLIEGGKLRVTDGPFVEAKEVIGGYAIFEFRDKDGSARHGQGVHAASSRAHARLGRHLRATRHGRSRPGNDLRRGRIPRARLMRAFGKCSRRR